MRPKKTILCVDDNPVALSIRKFMLETRGFRVLDANSPERGLEIFMEGGIDLVVTDLVMPNINGNELIGLMKEISPDVPMLLVSGAIVGFGHGTIADAFLAKGSNTPLELISKVKLMTARKRGPKRQSIAVTVSAVEVVA